MSLVHRPTPHRLRTLMLLVSLCLLPGTVLYAWQFGTVVWLQTFWCVLLALGFEAGLLRLRGHDVRKGLSDLSWLVLGLILARALPLLVPLWMMAVASFAALALCKHGSGGLGRNRLNPAMVGLGIIAICFYQQLYPAPTNQAPWTLDLSTAEVLLQQLQLAPRLSLDAFAGATQLALGEYKPITPNLSGYGYVAGGLILATLRVIRIEIPLAMLGSTALLCLAAGYSLQESLYSLSLGGCLFTAFFIATDPVTSPDSRGGRILFGATIGVLTELIREFGLYADGLCFAVLAANLLVPQINGLMQRAQRPWYDQRAVLAG
ncbi:RnfABCDGE type electron transport complex subunit D [Pseudomonas lalucatii]|uniref:RnfABCDGE type electron transport complex subunit D n=1 Tax=Pseudomonas lalucatii TaxID=1424203 RepID=A0ABS5PXV5_9PSED|nr:RnfABCDGE type electron transport complex subunit D [Pseudomonas lalucatii]MBS7661328.1 RnfABCDGE type electron transport complex subunit D [Pseudomonas lalucatii]MBS7724158.1 RnfABCDGE type electron transport complex subunit D [Pseudomonas lalucatii]QVM87840.1 RnfABCDGE type electron transport complex subunit D [Pseudomonas lalucatii]